MVFSLRKWPGRAALPFLAVVVMSSACSPEALPVACGEDGADGGCDSPDAGRDGSDDAGLKACVTHTDCPCTGGLCLSTGKCWCPPCELDADCPEGRICRGGNCVRPCLGPLRLSPDRGPTSGGTLITFEGQEFHIGALEWWARIGDGPWLLPVYGFYLDGLPCAISFLTPPMPEGTYPAYILYGWPPFDPLPEDSRAGSFTYQASDSAVGHGFCRGPAQCESPVETCDLGTGRCVPDLCLSLFCGGFGGLCDSIEGCVDGSLRCNSSSDCKLIRSSCGCQAVHVLDQRDRITSCALGGCESCEQNHCDTEHLEAVCVEESCTERRGDPQGVSCDALAYQLLAGQVQSDGWIQTPRAASLGEKAAVAWMQPADQPYYRYGLVRSTLIDAAGNLLGPIATLGDPAWGNHSPSVASDESSLGVVWVSERPMPCLLLQWFDGAGSLVGEPQLLGEQPETWLTLSPLLARGPQGYHLFWSQEGGSADGLYHADLTQAGALSGPPEHLPWIKPRWGYLSVVQNRDRFKLTWSSSMLDLEGLLLSDLPVSESPIWLVSGTGSLGDLVSTGQGFALAWQEDLPGSGSPIFQVYFQAFDQDSQPLCERVLLQSRGPWLHAPKLAYLGGVFVVSWFEQDGYQENASRRIVAASVSETGRRLSGVETLVEGPLGYDHFHARLGDAILTGYSLSGQLADSLGFVRFQCAGQ